MGVIREENADVQLQNNDGPQEAIDTNQKSGLLLSEWFLYINICCFVVVMAKNYLFSVKGFYNNPVSNLMKIYVQKVSLMNLLSGMLAYAVAYWLTNKVATEEDVENVCITIEHMKYMVLFALGLSCSVCTIRYAAFGLASSENHSSFGKDLQSTSDKKRRDLKSTSDQKRRDMKSAGDQTNIKPDILMGFDSKKSDIFLRPARLFTIFALAVFLVACLFLLFSMVPEPFYTFLFHWRFCIPGEVLGIWNKTILIISCTLLYNVTVIVSEKVYRKPSMSDVRGVIFTTPFTTTTAGTSCAAWLFLLTLMVFWLKYCAMQVLLIWGFLSCLDAMWTLFLVLSITNLTNTRM